MLAKGKNRVVNHFLTTGSVVFTQLTLAFTLGCSAYDLGQAGTTFYPPTNPDQPDWEDNINNIVKFKCASCHTRATPWFKPANTPDKINEQNQNFSLNRIELEAFFDERNQEMMRLVEKCIVDVCGTEGIPMPPNYATPLNDVEKQGLVNFVKRFIVKSDSTLSAFFQDKCATCHGDDGKSRSISTNNKQIGESQSDTFEKYKNAYTNISPMPSYSSGYSDADAESDWKQITGQ